MPIRFEFKIGDIFGIKLVPECRYVVCRMNSINQSVDVLHYITSSPEKVMFYSYGITDLSEIIHDPRICFYLPRNNNATK